MSNSKWRFGCAEPTTADVVAELRRLNPHSQVLRFFDELEQEPRAGCGHETSKSNPPDCADTRSTGARLILRLLGIEK